MNKLRLSLAAVLVTVLVAGASSPARAQSGDLKDQRHLLEMGLYLGALFPSAHHELYRKTRHEDFKTAAFDIGLRVAYLPVAFLGVELEAGLMPTKTVSDGKALLWAVRAHALFQYPLWKRFAPFAVVGGGTLGVSSKPSVQGSDDDAHFHWGVGFKYYPTNWLNVRLDLRHLIGPKNTVRDYTSSF